MQELSEKAKLYKFRQEEYQTKQQQENKLVYTDQPIINLPQSKNVFNKCLDDEDETASSLSLSNKNADF